MPLGQSPEVDDMLRRQQVAMGESVMNAAMGLMREVRDEVRSLRSEISEINKERRDEARDSGANRADIANVKRRLDNNDRFTAGLSVVVLGQVLWAMVTRALK